MELREYMAIKHRMVKTNSQKKCNIGCWLCPLSDQKNGMGIGCRELEWRYPEKAEDIVKQWAKEHPAKTYAQDFLSKFPKAPKDNYGTPAACRKTIYGGSCIDNADCEDCWNEPMEESN
ncbi:Uncharacterised protein [Anaerotruncus sp. 2789STDY5834896]|uniref:Uncharacterized protein n=1 Tax=uncultured Anaerotruncus sp. TaxID=905011 RepID=A0A1C6I905_9FIRM|nr:Uncharacterised protein [uncultured Anaerotruncus sp.]